MILSAPFLTPRDMRPKPQGGRNEPAFLKHISQVAAAVISKDALQLATETTANSKHFFGLNSPNLTG